MKINSSLKKSFALLLPLIALCAALLVTTGYFLRVSAEERLMRAIEKVYGERVSAEEIALEPDLKRNAYGEIEICYLLSDGNYLMKSTGSGGFKNGTVTVWTALACEGAHRDGDLVWKGVKKVVYESSKKQSYIEKTATMYKTFALSDEKVVNGALFSPQAAGSDIKNLAAGATMSSAATCNAVNAALVCFKNAFLGAENKFAYQDYIDLSASSAAVSGFVIDYALAVKGNSPAKSFLINVRVADGVITEYEIVQNGSTSEKYLNSMPQNVKDGTFFTGKNAIEIAALLTEQGALIKESGLLTGATRSVESCVRAAAFAVFNYDLTRELGGLHE